MASFRRTHTCGELRESEVGQSVTLSGWVNTYRDHGQFVFIDLRDRYGFTQVVFEPGRGKELFEAARELRAETCVAVRGVVGRRLPGKERHDMPTGLIEVQAAELIVLNRCPTPPFDVSETPGVELANEDLRLQYRYLDLRRPSQQKLLILRHQMIRAIREYLSADGFLEVETPFLGRSTPEGARDYLVPSRVHNGAWYALPQSPQLYKQLLMVAGYDKYFQIARCMRDEDLRADRQPEFTQLDFEMSFVEQDDVLGTIEGLVARVFKTCVDVDLPTPFARLSYDDAMLRYGSDKPDLRFGLEIVDCTDLAPATEFTVFKSAAKVRAIRVPGTAEKFSRKQLDELTEYVRQFGAKGLAWIKVEAGKLNSPIEKFLPAASQASFRERLQAEPGDLLLFVADSEDVVCQSLGNLRLELARRLQLIDPSRKDFKVAWVLDFPNFMFDAEEQRWVSNHHPFTAPQDADLARMESDTGSVKAKAYDLVINGYEAGGGSIRIHNPEVQARVFAVLGLTPEQAREKFGFLLDALKFGAPPHGGIALGLDRLTMILGGTTNIRDVIAFPKNKQARDLMTGAPGLVESRQLKELGLNS
ncbi:MAG: aspartate--tRNA ligase [Gemmataceae bacterium]|nr:aspartate--tRNA ligase [Gemmataceae bacterium]